RPRVRLWAPKPRSFPSWRRRLVVPRRGTRHTTNTTPRERVSRTVTWLSSRPGEDVRSVYQTQYNQSHPSNLMNVLVTGATGFTGGHLAIALRRRGHAVRALVRPRSLAKAVVLEREGISIAQGDLVDAESVRRATDNIEVVYHVAAT